MPPRSHLLVALLVCAPLVTVRADAGATDDPVLTGLLHDALEHSPEYAQARAAVAAERERIPQAGALPDPTLTLGIQNDGFKRIEIGNMDTSFWQVMVTQPLPWPGKRSLRAGAARSLASAAEAQAERVRLTTVAEVERGYVELLLVRSQLDLLARLEALWREAEAISRARYGVGAVPQSDIIRAQLERTRLAQQRIALEASTRTRVQVLNRLRVHPLDEPIETARRLADLAEPSLPSPDEVLADAERRSPDLAEARLARDAADQRLGFARRDRYPDFVVSAAVMPRGGLDPMWTASVGITLPIFSGKKAAVDESSSRREASGQAQETTRQVVQLRAGERHAVLDGLLRTARLYREALLVQSDAAVRSTVGQYQVGKVTFASVLEVMRGLVNDEGGYLDTLAQAQRVAIAQREVSLSASAGVGGGGAMGGGGTVPGSGGMTASARPSGGSTEAPAGAASSSGGSTPSGM
jgi:cobalt-zinc-cadmium efflux system outer membrane protein